MPQEQNYPVIYADGESFMTQNKEINL